MTEYSNDFTVDEILTVLMAREVRNDDVMIVGGSLCSAADSNTNGVVDITELMSFIERWKDNEVSIVELMNGIGEWKNGC